MKYHKPNDLKQQKFVLSQFWRPEVHHEGISWAAPPSEALQGNLPVSLRFWWLSSFPMAVSLQSLPPFSWGLLFCVFMFSPPQACMRTLVIGCRAHPDKREWSHLEILNYICNGPLSKYSHSQVLGIRMWTYVSKDHHSTHSTDLKLYPNLVIWVIMML